MISLAVPECLREFRSVILVTFKADGSVLEGNSGFAAAAGPSVTGSVADFFINPLFSALIKLPENEDGLVWRGLFTLGSSDAKTRSLNGVLYKNGEVYSLAADHDIDDLLRVTESVLELNGRLADQERELARANAEIKRALAENSRLKEEAERKAEEQGALSAIATAASQSLKLHEMVRRALDTTVEVTKRTIGIVRLKENGTGRLKIAGVKGISEADAHALDGGEGAEHLEALLAGEIPFLAYPSSSKMKINDSLGGRIQSRLYVPIHAHGQTHGVLTVASEIVAPFEPREIELLETIGRIFGTAVTNVQLYQKSQRDLKRMHALREIDRAIASTMNLRERLNVLLEKLELFFPYPSGSAIRLVDKKTNTLEFLACRYMDEQAWKERSRRLLGLRSLQVVESKTTLALRHLPAPAKDHELYRGFMSFILVPLIVKDDAIGILSVYTRDEHEFTLEDVRSLEMLASHGAIAIHETRLHEEAERRQREAEELARVARSLTEILDVSAVGKRIVTSVRDLFNARAGTVRLMEPDGSLCAIACSGESYAGIPAGHKLAPGTGAMTHVITHGTPFWSADIGNDPAVTLTEAMRAYVAEKGTNSVIAVPMRTRNILIGALALSDRPGRTYSAREVMLLQTFADQAALALENARLFADISRRVEELRVKTGELERANKAKDEFLGVMSHELRTPLNVIIGYTALLKDRIMGEITSEQEHALSKVMERANDQLQLINSILQATQLEAGSIRVVLQSVDLGNFLEELRSRYDIQLKKDVSLCWDISAELPVLKTDSEKLKHILQNLIDNAIKFTERGRIVVSVRTNAGAAEFKVTDTGTGIPKDTLPYIFEMFRQADSSENRPFEGVGLGLYIVKKLLDALDGKVEVETEQGKGSTFTVTLPANADPKEIPGKILIPPEATESSDSFSL